MSEPMTDLEMTRLSAEAMGYDVFDDYRDCHPHVDGVAVRGEGDGVTRYHPLTNDAQAMALVKRFAITIDSYPEASHWDARIFDKAATHVISGAEYVDDLNRAIVTCVAQMHQSPPAASGKAG